MQLRIDRHTLIIVPETDQDIAFLEDTLLMKNDGDVLKFERVNNESDSWVKFKIESFPKVLDETPTMRSGKTTSRKSQEVSRRFKDFSSCEDYGENVTLVDVEYEE